MSRFPARGSTSPILAAKTSEPAQHPNGEPCSRHTTIGLPNNDRVRSLNAPELVGLDDVDWAGFHFCGNNDEIPALIRGMPSAQNDDDWLMLEEDLFLGLKNSGTIFSAAIPAAPFLCETVTSGCLEPAYEFYVIEMIVSFVETRSSDLIICARHGMTQPMPEPESVNFREAIRSEARALLGLWPSRPVSTRLSLAPLAGLYPEHGGEIVGDIRTLALEVDEAAERAGLDLAVAVIEGNPQAMRLAREVGELVSGDGILLGGWADLPGVPDDARVEHALVTCLLHAADRSQRRG
jgi:hypothetical protein